MKSHPRLKSESALAYAAFCIYRDLGPDRSLDAAWQKRNAELGGLRPSLNCPGYWQRWSVQWKWVDRAREFDLECDAARCKIREAALREREQERMDFEIENQRLMQNNVLDMQALLKKVASGPITDIVQIKEEVINGKVVKTTTKIKGVNLAGYARLNHERNDTGRQVVERPRKTSPVSEESPTVDRVVLKPRRPE